jgi:hypothetical protein
MNSKNWNDRADKDLFFTILSVKNIGVISGSEWTTIGGHMRTLGYGFTNEGCRQHFQGLRRAQHKAESNGATAESPHRVDPAMNPITRRPGPGRGRPKKQQTEGESSNVVVAPPPEIANIPPSTPSAVMPQANMDSSQPSGLDPYEQHIAELNLASRSRDLLDQQFSPDAPGQGPQDGDAPDPSAIPLKVEAQEEEADAEGEPEADADGEVDPDEPVAKRRRMDETPLTQHQPLDDEAVLQLAAHGDGGPSEHYHPDFSYGET